MARQMQEKMMLRLPDGLRDRIKDEAARNRRSMNSEVVIHLERALGEGVQTTAGASLQATDPTVVPNTSARQGADVING